MPTDPYWCEVKETYCSMLVYEVKKKDSIALTTVLTDLSE